MLTEKDYCDYETCVALKELGYVGSSRYYYTQQDRKFHYDAYNKFYTVRTADAMGYVLAVHLYEAQKWLRNTHNLHISTKPYPCEDGLIWMYEIRRFTPHLVYVSKNKTGFQEAEEALSEGVRASIKILQDEQKENN